LAESIPVELALFGGWSVGIFGRLGCASGHFDGGNSGVGPKLICPTLLPAHKRH
jgi:hypothetical protein